MSTKDVKTVGKQSIQQRSVLVVDDSETTRASIRDLLYEEGMQDVATASTAEQALEIMQTGDVDIIIADYHLPGMNGGELFRRIQKNRNDVQMFLMSGKTDYPFLKEVVELDISGFLSKPTGIQQLTEVLKQAVE